MIDAPWEIIETPDMLTITLHHFAGTLAHCHNMRLIGEYKDFPKGTICFNGKVWCKKMRDV